MPKEVTVNFDRPKLKRLKRAYKKARDKGSDQFKFEGNDYLTDYATYLIEYLDGVLN